jgi:hypothetical protein
VSTLLAVLMILAVWRVARLVTVDFITEPIRAWAARRGEKVGYLFECPWCLSIWLAPLVAAGVFAAEASKPWLWIVLLTLVGSGAAGLLTSVEDRLDR